MEALSSVWSWILSAIGFLAFLTIYYRITGSFHAILRRVRRIELQQARLSATFLKLEVGIDALQESLIVISGKDPTTADEIEAIRRARADAWGYRLNMLGLSERLRGLDDFCETADYKFDPNETEKLVNEREEMLSGGFKHDRVQSLKRL